MHHHLCLNCDEVMNLMTNPCVLTSKGAVSNPINARLKHVFKLIFINTL